MTEATEKNAPRDRSPAFPSIPIDIALARLADFDTHFKWSPARPEKVGDAWGFKNKAHADRVAAALKYFGLLDYQGNGKDRQIVISEDGRKYLRAQQEETKRDVAKAAALKPKQIAKFWGLWRLDRPADSACLDELVLKNDFSESGARDFLKVYDATIAYAKPSDHDKVPPSPSNEDDTPEPASSMGEAIKSEATVSAASHSISRHATQPMPPWPAGVEMNPDSKDQFNLAMYSAPEGSRIRISADLDLKGVKRLARLLENRIKMMEEEESGG
jgi:hypothetical protein